MPVQTMVGPPSPDWLIQTIDYAGIWVGLARSIWETKILSLERGHPEVAPYLDSITTCIQLPDIVFQSKQRQDTHLLYQVEAGVGRYQGKHLIVVVKYVREAVGVRGYVTTVYLSRGIYSGGVILWQRIKTIDT